MLWFNTSGRASKMASSDGASPRQSEISTSTVVPGVLARMARTVLAMAPAPPSGRSSRATHVTTAWPSPIRSTASATRSGSSGDSGAGWRVST